MEDEVPGPAAGDVFDFGPVDASVGGAEDVAGDVDDEDYV